MQCPFHQAEGDHAQATSNLTTDVTEIHLGKDSEIICAQLEFYKSGKAGCLFLARAARSPAAFEWRLTECEPNALAIAHVILESIQSKNISTQSILFGSVRSIPALGDLLAELDKVEHIILDVQTGLVGFVCLGYRVKVQKELSWMTGFGDFEFLPPTRRAPYTELTFRCKPRPQYEWVLKTAPDGVIHLADMHMKGLSRSVFEKYWNGSILHTQTRLGGVATLASAAKTTFAIPDDMWNNYRTNEHIRVKSNSFF